MKQVKQDLSQHGICTSLFKIGNVGHQQRELRFPRASSIAIRYHPPVGKEKLGSHSDWLTVLRMAKRGWRSYLVFALFICRSLLAACLSTIPAAKASMVFGACYLSPQERTGAVPLARHIPPSLCHGQRQRRHQVLHLAEANNSHALKGLVAVAGRVQIRGHLGLAALSMRHKSTLGARLRKCNLVHCAAHRCLALVDSAGSFLRCTFALGQSYCGGVANVLAAAHLL